MGKGGNQYRLEIAFWRTSDLNDDNSHKGQWKMETEEGNKGTPPLPRDMNAGRDVASAI